jgi:hypothetical protein
MRKTTIIGIVLGALLLSGTAAALESRKGLELEARLGPNTCVKTNDVECDDFGNAELKPGFGGGGYIGLRPLSFLSIGLDIGAYSLTPKPNDLDVKIRTTQAMLNLRLYIPFNVIEPFLKLGVGYLAWVQSGENSDAGDYKARAYSWGNFKFGGGLTIYLIDSEKVGNIGLGADLDFAMIKPTKYKTCYGDDCESGDIDDGDSTAPYAMQFNLHFKWIIPIF